MQNQNNTVRREIAFINGNLADMQTLISGLRPGIEIIVLDAGTDGLAQIESALAGRSGLDAIHLVGHGASGQLQVGNSHLDTAFLKSNAQAMASIGASLAADGDILVYGCDTGAGSEGIEFARTLAALTGADVAASDDATGAGGDWALEVTAGQVEATTMMADAGAAAYMATLAISSGPVHTYTQNTWAFSSMAQGADGNLYLAHKLDYTSISIKKWTGAGWTEITKLTTAMTGDTSFSDDLSLMVDADGNLDLLFKHAKNVTSGVDSMRGIKFGEFNVGSSTWTTKVVDQASHPNGWYNYDDPALAIAGNGVLHAVYNFSDASVHDYSIKYATSNDGGTNWTTSTVLTTTIAGIDELHQPTIRVDAAGNVHLFYVREDNQNDDYGNLYYATKAAGSSTWSAPLKIASHLETQYVLGTDGSGKFYIGHSTRTVDANNAITGSTLHVLSNESGSWVTSSALTEARDNYQYGIQVVNGDVFMLVSSSAPDWSDNNLYVMRKSGDTWIRGYQGESALPSLSAQGEDYFGEATFTVSPTGQITVVTEDGNLRNVVSTTGTLEDFGLVVNAAPVIAGLNGDAEEFAAGSDEGNYIDVQDDTSDPVAVTDTDSADFNGGKITITQASGAANGSFSFDHLGEEVAVGADPASLGGTPSANDKVYFNTAGGWVEVGRVHATLDGQAGRGLVIEFTSASASSAAAEALIKWLKYAAPTAGARSFSLSVSDGDGATSASSTFTMTGIDYTSPTVTSITSSTSDGVKKIGDVISIQVVFSEAVNVSGTPTLRMGTGIDDRFASYESGSGGNVLTFTYTVQAGDVSADLDVTGSTALDVGAGSIADLAGNLAILTLPAPGAAGSLSANKQIGLDGLAPTDLAISNAKLSTLDGAHALVGALSSTDASALDSFTYTLVSGTGSTDNASFEIVGNELRAIDASALTDGVKSLRIRTTDSAGNSHEEVLAVTVSTGPTVAISSNKASVKAGEVATITFTFSDAPDGFDATDVTVSGGAIGAVAVDPLNSKVYTATFTPTAGVQNLGAAISVAAGTFTNADGAANLASTANVAIGGDTAAPTVQVSTSRAVFKAGETATITFTFSEAPAAFDAGDVTVTGGTLGAVSATADPRTFTAQFTPDAGVESLAGLISIGAGAITDGAGNPNAASQVNVAVSGDTLKPVVADAHLAVSGASGTGGAFRVGDTVTVTWNDSASGDNNGDTAGATVDFSQFGGAAAVAATLTNGVWSASHLITAGAIDAIGNASVTVTDDAGNVTTVTDTSNALVDSQLPVVSNAALTLSGASGPDAGYRIGDEVVATWNGAADGNTDVQSVSFDFSQFGGGIVNAVFADGVWSASYVIAEAAISAGERNVAVSVTDNAGNATSHVGNADVHVDAVRPTVTGISSPNPDGRYKVGDLILIEVAFSEAVSVNGAASLELNTGGVATYLEGSGTDTLTFAYTVRAEEVMTLLDVSNEDALSGLIADLAGNAAILAVPANGAAGSLAASNEILLDGAAPQQISLSNSDITTLAGAHGVVGSLTSENAPGDDAATYTLAAGAGDSGNAAFEIVGGVLQAIDPSALAEGVYSVRVRATDMAGNSAEQVLAVTVHAPPTVEISSDVATVKAGETATITFTFSDTPVGFDPADVSVAGGTLSGFVADPLDPNVVTAIFTPSAGVQDLAAAISIAAGAFTDANGLANLASVQNVAIGGDTLAPAVQVSAPKTVFKAGETTTVTFTFSEAPAGFTLGDITVTGGTVSDLAVTADSKIYTATFTPSADVASLSGAISVGGATFTDAAGNQNAASTVNVALSGDTLRPVVADANLSVSGGTGSGGAFRAGDTVTVTWNDGASGDNNGDTAGASVDFSQFGGGAAVAATLTDGVWSASYQIAAGAIDGTGNVAVTVTDDAGNVTTGADSGVATIDNQLPVASAAALALSGATGAGGVYRIGDVVTATWDNATDGNADIHAVSFDFSQFGGGAVAATRAGDVWSATYTITEAAISASDRNVGITVTDDAANAVTLQGATNVHVDAQRATVTAISSSSPDGLRKAGDVVSIQVTFSEAVNVTGTPTLALETGAADRAATYESGSGSNVLTFTYTVQPGDLSLDLDVTGVAALSGGAIADLAGNAATLALAVPGAAGSLGANKAIGVDGIAPSDIALSNAVVTTLAGAHGIVGTFTATDGTPSDSVTYSLVAGDGAADNASFEIVGAQLRAIDPSLFAEGTKSVRVRATDAAGNSYEEVHAITVYAPPTVEISSAATTLKAGESTLVTFTFSDVPTGFAHGDVTVRGGTLGALSVDPLNAKVYTAIFTPAANVQNLDAAISVAAGTFSDVSLLANLASTSNVAIGGDTMLPTVALAIDKQALKAGETATVTFSFSEAPAGFSLADVTVSGGVLSGLAPTGDANVFTATFTPAADLASMVGAISVGGATFTDAAGNQNSASTTNVVMSVDTRAPVIADANLSISGATGSNGAFRAGDTVTVTWNDGVTGDNNGDTLTATVDFSQFGGAAAVAATLEGGVWRASYLIADGSIDAANRNVTVTASDGAGNVSTRTDSANALVDNQGPVVSDAALSLSGASGAGGVFRIGDVVTASWNAGVDGQADIAGASFDFSQFGGGVVAASASGNVWSASFTITEAGTDLSGRNVSVTVLDDAGNSAARTDSADARIDSLRPLVSSITLAGAPPANASAVEFTVVFSEAVSGIDAADFTLVRSAGVTGAISAVTGSGNTWTVRVSGIDGEGSLGLDLNGSGTGVADLSGNAIAGGFSGGAVHQIKFNAVPVITSNGGGDTALIEIAENTTGVTTLAAGDADGDVLGYSISGGADAALFEIDAATGVLRLKAQHAVGAPADSDHDNRFEVQVSANDSKGGIDTQSITVALLSDLDGDGTADASDDDMDNDGRLNTVEDPVRSAFGGGNGDGNGDGVLDSAQLNVASLPTAVAGAPFATLAVAGGYSLTSVSAGPAPSGLPRNVKLPLGQLDFTIGNVTPGGTVEMSIFIDADPRVNAYMKQNNLGNWVNIATSVTTVGAKTKITFSLTDGGAFDSDGVVNGSIMDPGGVAIVEPQIGSNGGGDTAFINVAEMTTLVTTVSASTLGTVSYAIAGGVDASFFEIDAATGVLRFIGTPDYGNPLDAGANNTYSVTVSATDAFGSDTQEIVVSVTDVAVIDGVSVNTGSRTNDDGSTSQVISIPVVAADREEQVGGETVADIPLTTSGNGTPVVTVQIPTGIGLEVSGSTPGSQAAALADLIREIRAVTEAGSSVQEQMTGGGSGFLAGLPADASLVVQTVVPIIATGLPAAGPLVIQGAAPSANGSTVALVVNGNLLPSGSEIHLNDVAFAAVVGELRITGGAGSQNVWGDGQSQYIMLGEDDDILHGGAGNDTVGSAGGDDRIFGDEGDDLVFGGIGNDFIDGGTGIDVVQLAGTGRSDYVVRVEDGHLVLAHRDGGEDGVDAIANVEVLRFLDASADTTAYGTITRLYEATLGRAPDTAGIATWMAALGRGATLETVAEHMLAGSEFLELGGSNADFVTALYRNTFNRTVDEAGLAYWTGLLDQGKVSKHVLALAVVDSAEKLAMPVARDVDLAATDVGTLVRMYDSLYGRSADEGGMNHWLSLSERGVSMGDIADGFVNSAEGVQLYGAMSNAEFVNALYHTALHRDAAAGEAEGWTRLLDEGRIDRGDVLLGFADSAEKIALVGSISTTIDGGGGA